jgi:hypothetical protein
MPWMETSAVEQRERLNRPPVTKAKWQRHNGNCGRVYKSIFMCWCRRPAISLIGPTCASST